MSFDSSWALSDSQSSPDSSSHSHRKRRHPQRDDDDSDQAEVWSDDDEAEIETRFERGGEGLDWGNDAGARREDHKRKRNDSRASREDRPPAFPPSSSSSSNAVASGLTTSYSPSLGPQSTPLSRIARTIQPRPSFTSPTPPDSSSSSSAPRRAPSSSSLVPPSSPIALPDYANSAQPYRRRNPSSSLPLSLRRPPLVRNASAVPDPAPYLRTSQPSNNDSSYFQSSSSSLSSSSRAYAFRTSAEPSWSSSSSQPSSQLHSPWLERRPGSLDSSGRLRGPSRVANEHWLGIPRNASTFAWPSFSPSTRALSGVVETGETSRSFELGGYERAGSGRSGGWQEGLEGQASSSSSSVETNLGQHNVNQSLHHLESQRFLLSSSTSARRSATLQPRWLPFGSASSGLAEVDEAHPLPSSSLTSNTDNPPTSSTSRSQHPLPPSYPYSLNPHASSTTPLASTSSRGFVFEDSVEPLSTPSERVTREDRRSSSPGETTAGRSTLRRRGAWQIADEGEPTTSASIPSFHAIQLDHPSLSSRRRAHSVSQTSQRERLSIFSPDSDTDSDDPPFASSSRDPPPFSTSSRLPIMLASGSLGHRSTSLDESRSMDLDGTPAQALSHQGSMSSTLRRRGPGSRQNAEGDVDQDQEDGDAVGGDNSRREDAGTGSSRLAHFLSRHEERRRDLLSEATHSLLAAPTMSRTLASVRFLSHHDLILLSTAQADPIHVGSISLATISPLLRCTPLLHQTSSLLPSGTPCCKTTPIIAAPLFLLHSDPLPPNSLFAPFALTFQSSSPTLPIRPRIPLPPPAPPLRLPPTLPPRARPSPSLLSKHGRAESARPCPNEPLLPLSPSPRPDPVHASQREVMEDPSRARR
jgi:hypothetical protein